MLPRLNQQHKQVNAAAVADAILQDTATNTPVGKNMQQWTVVAQSEDTNSHSTTPTLALQHQS